VEENIAGGLAGIAAAFVAGAVFGRVAGTDSRAIGDRVMSGLIAIPLISLAVNQAFPRAGVGWAIAAPVPLVIYLFLLYGSDEKFPHAGLQRSISDRFVLLLVLSVGAFYAVVAAIILAIHRS
jgi:hypothetical protein